MFDGDIDSLVAMLSEDAVMVGDGGGKGGAVTGPMRAVSRSPISSPGSAGKARGWASTLHRRP
jgi:hypothetical protein